MTSTPVAESLRDSVPSTVSSDPGALLKSCARTHPLYQLSLLVFALFASLFSHPLRADEVGAGTPLNQIQLTDVEGRVISGRLKSLDATGVTLDGTPPRLIACRDLVSISWLANRVQSRDNEPQLILANGDMLGVRPTEASEESLTGRWSRYPGWPPLTIPMEWVRGALFNPPRESDARFRLLERVTANSLKSDLLILQNGDSVTGQWQGLKGQKILFKTAAGTSQFDTIGVQAFSGNPELIVQLPVNKRPTSSVLCRLTDGSTFHLKSVRLQDQDKFVGTLQSGVDVQVLNTAISGLWFSGDRVTWLSDLSPESYRFTPYLSQEWPFRTDRSVNGGPLRLRGVSYPRGMGVHSRSELVYRLRTPARRFQATIGVDDDAAGKGSVTFEVLVDGKSAYKSPLLTGTSAAVAIPPLNIEGAKTLTLIVYFATQGDIQDHANWCNALLLN